MPKGEKLAEYNRLPEVRAMRSASNRGRCKPVDEISYRGIHKWVQDNFEHGTACERCEGTGKKLEWSSNDHVYTRNREDWQSVCRPCHRVIDGAIGPASTQVARDTRLGKTS